MIEYLTQLNDGDYSKLKDLLNDNDEDIIPKLLDGTLSISEAFSKLEKRRKKETPEEREARQAQKVYDSKDQSVQESIKESGETAESPADALTDDEVKEIMVNVQDLDDGLDDMSLEEMVEQSDQIEGFQAHKQKTGERERIDPAIKKATLARDNFTCQCCKMGGEAFVSVLDYHHVVPVYAGGSDSVENGISLCITCHNLVHQHGYGDLHLPAPKSEDELASMSERDRILYEEERMRYKRIVRLGDVCRKGLAKRGIKREQAKKDNPAYRVGRRMPGAEQTYEA
jgi:5-methylcytosine-specific restriction protein A